MENNIFGTEVEQENLTEEEVKILQEQFELYAN